jgi:hypothetical protein
LARFGTTALILVGDTTVKVAAALPSLTEVAPAKFVPVMTTVAPLWAWVGENDEIVGRPGFVTVKFCVLVAVPSEFVTAIFPVVALPGTVAVIFVPEFTV